MFDSCNNARKCITSIQMSCIIEAAIKAIFFLRKTLLLVRHLSSFSGVHHMLWLYYADNTKFLCPLSYKHTIIAQLGWEWPPAPWPMRLAWGCLLISIAGSGSVSYSRIGTKRNCFHILFRKWYQRHQQNLGKWDILYRGSTTSEATIYHTMFIMEPRVQRVLALCYFLDLEKVPLAKNCISKIFIL